MSAPRQVVVIGAGSTGGAFAAAVRRLDEQAQIAIVERELVGGECTYFACMPTKALLRPGEALAAARQVPGAREAVTGPLDPAAVFDHRDRVASGWDDAGQLAFFADRAIEVVRGEAIVTEPGRVLVGDRTLEYDSLAIATGSLPSVPPVPGLDGTPYWTNRDLAALRAVPASAIVLGGGPVGAEAAQLLARLGSRVAIVEAADRLLPRDDPTAGEILAEAFAAEEIAVHTGTAVERVAHGAAEFVAQLAGGETLRAERLLVATGRRPNVEGFGFERLGLTIGRQGIVVDERLRAAEHVWAIGDVNGIAPFTHVGKYQARVAAACCAGGDAVADHTAVPAVTFTDPQVASVGRLSGDETVSASWPVEATARSSTYERPKRRGFVRLVADRDRGVLVGACIVGPEAGEWLGQLTLAVRASVPVEVLRQTIQPYPTFSEAIFFAARDLPL